MTVVIRCECGQKLSAKDSQRGQSFDCPACGCLVTVPLQDDPLDFQTASSPTSTSKGSTSMTSHPSKGRESLNKSMILSVVAIVLSVLALASHFLANPLGSGISGYDLTTPKAALESMLRIVRDQNPMAQIEMEYLRSSPRAEEKLETLKVHRDAEYGGKKILFISYKEDGITQYETMAFEKDADTGYWFRGFVSSYDMDDAALQESMRKWGKQD